MRHGDAGLYAIAGAMIVSSGLMAICYSDMGRQSVPRQDAVGGYSPIDGDSEGCRQTTCDVADTKDVTVRIVIDDKSETADSSAHIESAPVASSSAGATRSEAVSGDDSDDASQKSRENRDETSSVRITDKNVHKASKAQVDAIEELMTKGLGRSASVKCTLSDWAGGKGSRLVISTCVDGKAFKSGKELSDAFGKLVADLVPAVGKQFDDVEIMSVMLYGMKDSDRLTEAPMYPKAKDMSWTAVASIDVPSVEKGSIGDVNHASVTYGGNPVSIDMTKYGFSSLPPEE